LTNLYSFNHDNPRFTVLDNFGFVFIRISIQQSAVCGRKDQCQRRLLWVLPGLTADCKHLQPAGFNVQQLDGAPAQTAHITENWIQANCSEFIQKNDWLLNSSDLNQLDCLGRNRAIQWRH